MAETSAQRRGAPASQRPLVVAVLAVCVVIQGVLQLGPLWTEEGVVWRLVDWWIEDAAISFAFARNVADGLGLVATPGMERVEAYSNPLWVALLAVGELVGLDSFGTSKFLAVLLGGMSVVLAWRLAVLALEDEEGLVPLLAPVLLACHPTPAIWGASGLENPLLLFGILAATWRTAVEARDGGPPWAAVAWLAVSVTRPEGIVYAAMGGAVAMLASWRAGRGLWPTVHWLIVFFVPFAAYHAVRIQYFAWAFPNTYYAKLGDLGADPWQWSNRGWSQARSWALQTGAGWLLPVAVVGVFGLRGWRAVAAPLVAIGLVAVWMHPDAPIARAAWWPAVEVPTDWTLRRVRLLLVLTALVPFGVAMRSGWTIRALLWSSGAVGLAFSVRANGDWMNGFRWMSFVAPQLVLLTAIGVGEAVALVRRVAGGRPVWFRGVEGALVVATVWAVVPLGKEHYDAFLVRRETDPAEVKLRADYTRDVLDRLWIRDQFVANLEVDMGAHLTWTGDRMLDYAGLVDVPIAHHSWRQRSFVEAYLFDEVRPHVAHIHKHWARATGIPKYPAWRQDWVPLPGYPERPRVVHGGMFARRDLFTAASSPPSEDVVRFRGGLEVMGFEAPAGGAVVGGELFLVVQARQRSVVLRSDTRLLGFLSNADGEVRSFDLPLGYDWLPPSEWRADEVAELSVRVPAESLSPGIYDLGLIALGANGLPLAAEEVRGAWRRMEAGASRFAAGEVRLAGRVVIEDVAAATARSHGDRQALLAAAEAGDCDVAEKAWERIWQRTPGAEVTAKALGVAGALAECRGKHALASDDPIGAVEDLRQARAWDVRSDGAWAAAAELSGRWMAEGATAWAQEDWAAASRWYHLAVEADPRRSWARRWAEEARDKHLGFAE